MVAPTKRWDCSAAPVSVARSAPAWPWIMGLLIGALAGLAGAYLRLRWKAWQAKARDQRSTTLMIDRIVIDRHVAAGNKLDAGLIDWLLRERKISPEGARIARMKIADQKQRVHPKGTPRVRQFVEAARLWPPAAEAAWKAEGD